MRCRRKPQEVWELHNENHGLAFRPFSYQTGILPKGGRVPLDTLYWYPDRRSYDYFALSRSHGGHCIQLRRVEQTEDDHDLILPVSLNPALEIPVNTLEPIPLRQRRPFFKVNERGMCVNLPDDDIPSNDYRVYQLAQYTGTFATLKNIASMYVSDPPCQRAVMDVTISWETIKCSPTPCRIIARLCYISLESSTGLKMVELLRALSREPCRSHRLMKSPYEGIHPDIYRHRGGHGDWDDGLTVFKLQSLLHEHFKRMHMRQNSVVEMEIRLLDNLEGLRPIVPTAAERSVVVDRWVLPALYCIRHEIY